MPRRGRPNCKTSKTRCDEPARPLPWRELFRPHLGRGWWLSSMTTNLRAAEAALQLASVPANRQAEIIDVVLDRLDYRAAISRRDAAIREAYGLIGSAQGSVRVLAQAMAEFSARVYPCWRHLSAPPAEATPLRAALFRACQAADDAGAYLPGERQIRRIVS